MGSVAQRPRRQPLGIVQMSLTFHDNFFWGSFQPIFSISARKKIPKLKLLCFLADTSEPKMVFFPPRIFYDFGVSSEISRNNVIIIQQGYKFHKFGISHLFQSSKGFKTVFSHFPYLLWVESYISKHIGNFPFRILRIWALSGTSLVEGRPENRNFQESTKSCI